MRIDKFLKVSRIIKRRTVANDACDGSKIFVNGKPVKASYHVKTGDIIEIHFGDKIFKAEVTQINENVRKEDASAMYREIE